MLTNRSKIAYATGAVPNGIKVDMFTFFLLFYYGNVVGLEPGLAGLAIAIALFFDAFTDPIIGSISDRTNSSIGRRHPYLFASVVPIVVGYVFLFMPRSDWDLTQSSLFVWMLSFCIITRFGMTLFDVPHRALGGEITKDYDERTALFSIRELFGWLAGLSNAFLVTMFSLHQLQNIQKVSLILMLGLPLVIQARLLWVYLLSFLLYQLCDMEPLYQLGREE